MFEENGASGAKTREAQRSLKMMRDSAIWPMWPWLPVKSRVTNDPEVAGFPLCGIMTVVQYDEVGDTGVFFGEARPKVYLTNFLMRDIKTCKVLEYADLEAVVDDGWVVD